MKLIDQLGLVQNAAETGAYFRQAMTNALAEHPQVGDVRGEGLLLAVELVADKARREFHSPVGQLAGKVNAALLKRGVISRAMPQGDILGFAPPLCLTQTEADIIVAAMTEAVIEVCGPI